MHITGLDLAAQAEGPGLRLGTEGQLHGQEAVLLGHGGLGSVQDVVDQLPPEGQLLVLAVDVPCLLLVHEETRPWGLQALNLQLICYNNA